MLSLIIPYRNRDVVRVTNCLNSLAAQTHTNFEVVLVDNGSDVLISSQINELASKYNFCTYIYLNTCGLIWNKSYAINVGVNIAKGNTIMIVDVDLLFAPNFLQQIATLNFDNRYYNYKCLYLPQNYAIEHYNWAVDNSAQLSNSGLSTGLVIASKKDFENINGYDEYYQGWGLEDDDFCNRLNATGLTQTYLNHQQYVSLHQYHPVSYANVPTTWYTHLLQYTHATTTIKRNIDGAGALAKYTNRLCMTEAYDALEKIVFTPKEFLSITGFNGIYTAFFNLKSNTALQLNYLQPLALSENSTSFKIKNSLLTQIIKNKIISNYPTLLAHSYLTTEKLHEFMINFISLNRSQLLDYYIDYVPNKSLIIKLVKK